MADPTKLGLLWQANLLGVVCAMFLPVNVLKNERQYIS
jgi:hypothetical protein